MMVKKGQFWFNINEPYNILEVKSVEYTDENVIESVCSLWTRYELGKYVKIKDNYWMICYKHEFNDWKLLDFGV